MARKRLVSPEFFQHGPLYDAEQASGLPLRLAFAGLWCQADREGRFRLRPRELKLGVLPYDNVDFGAVLSALQTYGFIKAYVVDGESFAYIPSFHRWQTFHVKEGASTVPAPCETGASTGKSGASTAITGTGTVSSTGTDAVPSPTAPVSVEEPKPAKRSKAPARGATPQPEPVGFADAWAAYPSRPNNSRAEASRAYAKRLAEGADPLAILDGVVRYATYCEKEGIAGNYRKQAATFFGPDRHWESDYTVSSKVDADLVALAEEARPEAYANAEAVRLWMARTMAETSPSPISPFGTRSGLETPFPATGGASS